MSVIDYYSQYWTAEGFNPSGGRSSPYLESALKASFPKPPGKVLDVGCGDSMTSGPTIRAAGLDYQGIDISPTAIALATKNGYSATVVDDIATLPYADATFDAVVCIEVIEHLFDPLTAVKEIRRVLKPVGRFVVSTPNTAFWRRRFDYFLLGRFNPYGDNRSIAEPWRDPHIRFFTKPSLATFLRAAGFSTVQIGGTNGSFWDQLPWLGRYLRKTRPGPMYRSLERIAPAFWASQLVATATA